MDDAEDTMGMTDSLAEPATGAEAETDDVQWSEAEDELCKNIVKEIKADKKAHAKSFKKMRDSMQLAAHGCADDWKDKYTANIIGRHIRAKTAALYAKNPKAVARRRETLDFKVWDEDPNSLMMAMQTIQMASAQPPTVDPMTGAPQPGIPPELQGAVEQANAIVQDFQQGMARRDMLKKLGRTLEVLFAHALRNQQPLDFKQALKKVVRRTCTTGVGYVEIGFQREMGPDPVTTAKLTDARDRLKHLQSIMHEAQEGEVTDTDAEMAELEASIAALTSEPEIILREGLIFDFPRSTRVIPDRGTQSLVGFVGSQRVTIEYPMSVQDAEEMFDVDLGTNYTPYSLKGEAKEDSGANIVNEQDGELVEKDGRCKDDIVCVWKTYDKKSGLVYYTIDGYKHFVRKPAAPDVFVSDFWPLYVITFNDVESETELFPPSDAELLSDMQSEVNRSRQGKREHRNAARPRWAAARGSLSEEDMDDISNAEAFDVLLMDKDPQVKLGDLIESFPVPGVDPNLYDTNEVMGDMQLVAGAQQAQLGAVSNSTATESAIAAQSASTDDSSCVDDLDAFLSTLARASSQVLMREMSADTVMKIVGPGAVWPVQTAAEIAEEIYLDVEAGSSGKPNQAVEIRNWQQMLPFLIQMPGINPMWLARESLRRLDDRLDLTEAVAAGIPSIVMQNSMKQPGAESGDPNAQGAEGANNKSKPAEEQAGSDAPMGNNRTTPPEIQYGAQSPVA